MYFSLIDKNLSSDCNIIHLMCAPEVNREIVTISRGSTH